MREERSGGGKLKQVAGIIAASVYLGKNIFDMLPTDALENGSALSAVFAAGMHARLKSGSPKTEGPSGELSGEVLDRIAHKHMTPSIRQELQSAYESQYRKLKKADEELVATGLDEAFLKSPKLNSLAYLRSLKAHALKSDSPYAKLIVDIANRAAAGKSGASASVIKLVYNAGYEAGSYVNLDQYKEKLESLPEAVRLGVGYGMPVLSYGYYTFNKLRKLSLGVPEYAFVGAAAAIDAVFEGMSAAEKEELEASIDSGDSSYLTQLENLFAEVRKDTETVMAAEKAKLDKEISTLSEDGVVGVLAKKPHKVDKTKELLAKQEATQVLPSAVPGVIDSVTAVVRGADAALTKQFYQAVKGGVSGGIGFFSRLKEELTSVSKSNVELQ